MAMWSAIITHFNGRYDSLTRTLIIESSGASSASSKAIRQYKERGFIKPRSRVEGYTIVIRRLKSRGVHQK